MTETMQADWIRFLESTEGEYAAKKWSGDMRHMCWAFHLWMTQPAVPAQSPGEAVLPTVPSDVDKLVELVARHERAVIAWNLTATADPEVHAEYHAAKAALLSAYTRPAPSPQGLGTNWESFLVAVRHHLGHGQSCKEYSRGGPCQCGAMEAFSRLAEAVTKASAPEAVKPPAPVEGDVALMDAFIADVCQNGGQHSASMDAWCEANKALWARIKASIHPTGTATAPGAMAGGQNFGAVPFPFFQGEGPAPDPNGAREGFPNVIYLDRSTRRWFEPGESNEHGPIEKTGLRYEPTGTIAAEPPAKPSKDPSP